MKIKRIKETYRAEIEEIIKLFNYIEFTEEEINESLQNVDELNFSKSFIDQLYKIISKKVVNNAHIIDEFINKNISLSEANTLNELNKIFEFFEKVNFDTRLDRYFTYVLRNSTIMSLLSKAEKLGIIEEAPHLERLIGIYKITKTRIRNQDKELLYGSSLNYYEDRDRLFKKYMYLVTDYIKTIKKLHIEKDDLIQEGNISLIKAIDSYNLEYNFDFQEYASWFVKNSIDNLNKKEKTEYLKSEKPNQNSTNIIEKFKNITREELIALFMYESGHSYIEIAEKLKISIEEAEQYVTNAFKKITEEPLVNENSINELPSDGLVSDSEWLEENKYKIASLYITLLQLGHTFSSTQQVLKSLEETTKAKIYSISNPNTSVKDSYSFILALKKLIIKLEQKRTKTITEEYIENELNKALAIISSNTVIIDVYDLMRKNGFKDYEITAALKQMSEPKLKPLIEYTGGNINCPQEVLKSQVKYSKLRSSIDRLETLLIKNRKVLVSVEQRKIYFEEIRRKASSVMFTYSDQVSFMTTTDSLIILLYSGLVDDKKFEIDEISEIIQKSSKYIIRVINRNEKIFLENLNLLSDYSKKLV